jgi:diphthamide synthase (EF-2-diphthine--ammonia ligase)
LVVSVDTARAAAPFLGREFDSDVVTGLSVIDGLDPCGEQGEYHTYVFDGPEFRHPVGYAIGEIMEQEGHRFIDLLPGNGRLDRVANSL